MSAQDLESTPMERNKDRDVFNLFPSRHESNLPKQMDIQNDLQEDAAATDGSTKPNETENAAPDRLWSVYTHQAAVYDKPLIENWKGDMSAMLIFSGLFSGTLTAFIIESYRTLQSDTGTMTVSLLIQLSQQLSAMSNGSTAATVIGIDPLSNLAFQPSTSSIICNTLWFISLTLSLTCALLATLVDQWCRDYLHKTDMLSSPVQRAKLVSFLYSGLTRFGMHAMIDLIPMLLHTSLFLFLAGLVAFFSNVNVLIMYIMSGFLAVFVCIYFTLSALPIVSLDSPYRTPLSQTLWHSLRFFSTCFPLYSRRNNRTRGFSLSNANRPRTITDAIIEKSFENSSEREERALQWTVSTLTNDMDLLPLLEALPDAIYSRGGQIVRGNDRLFWSLLESRNPRIALGRRLVTLLKGVMGNRPMQHAARLYAKTVCLNALWALSLISEPPRSGVRAFSFWFDRETLTVLDDRDRAVSRKGASDQPDYEIVAAKAAVRHCRLNQLRGMIDDLEHLISKVAWVSDVAVCRSTVAIMLSEIEVSDFETAVFPDSLAEVLQRLKSNTYTSIDTMQTDLRLINQPSYWVGARLLIACEFLLSSQWFITTFLEIIKQADPAVVINYDFAHYLTWTIFPQVDSRTCTHWPGRGVQGCDRFTSMALRFLPFIINSNSNLCTAAHSINKYFSARNSRKAILYIIRYCDMESLTLCLLVNLRTGNILVPECLKAIWTLCSLYIDSGSHQPRNVDGLINFLDAAQPIIEQRCRHNEQMPLFASTMALLVQCRLRSLAQRLEHCAIQQVALVSNDQSPPEKQMNKMRLVNISHSIHQIIISPGMKPVPVDPTTEVDAAEESIIQRVHQELADAYLHNLCTFLLKCAGNNVPFKARETIKLLSRVISSSNRHIVHPSIQQQFAQSFQAIVDHLNFKPNRELATVVRELSKLINGHHFNLKLDGDEESRRILNGALLMYQEMLGAGRVDMDHPMDEPEESIDMRFSSTPDPGSLT